jgi:hypothetical protein
LLKKVAHLFRTDLCRFNPLEPKLVYILFKNSVRTSKRTPDFTIKKINWLTLFKKIIAVYSENKKHTSTKWTVTDC